MNINFSKFPKKWKKNLQGETSLYSNIKYSLNTFISLNLSSSLGKFVKSISLFGICKLIIELSTFTLFILSSFIPYIF